MYEGEEIETTIGRGMDQRRQNRGNSVNKTAMKAIMACSLMLRESGIVTERAPIDLRARRHVGRWVITCYSQHPRRRIWQVPTSESKASKE